MPYKRRKVSHRKRDVIPKTMTRTLVWESDIYVPSNQAITGQSCTAPVAVPGLGGTFTTYCPTYLCVSANCPSDIFPNIPINASDGTGKMNFTCKTRARDTTTGALTADEDYDVDRQVGMMQTLNWRRQCPKGWREAGKHYRKYRVMSSSIQVDLVPSPLRGDDNGTLTGATMITQGEADAYNLDWSKYGNILGTGSDAVTTVASLHQQHFRSPGELYRLAPKSGEDLHQSINRRVALKRIITAGTIHTKTPDSVVAGSSIVNGPGSLDKDAIDYDPQSAYRYLPYCDTTQNFHHRWPKTRQYVIPAFADKISPWSHPKKRHLFRAGWKCPSKKDSEEREEYEAYLRGYNVTAVIQNDATPQPAVATTHTIDTNFKGSNDTNRGPTVPQREQMYILRLGGQDIVYPLVKDTLAQQSNHAAHTFHIRVSYNVMFFERLQNGRDGVEETLDTTKDNINVDKISHDFELPEESLFSGIAANANNQNTAYHFSAAQQQINTLDD